MIGIGERAGSGVTDIFAVWDSQGWNTPEIEELYNPDRTILTLSFKKKQAEKASRKNRQKKQTEKTGRNGQASKTIENKQRILDILKKENNAKAAHIAEYIGLSSARTRVLLSELIDEGKVRPNGTGRSRCYSLTNYPA